MIGEVRRWLIEGDEEAAAALLADCEMHTELVDVVMPISGGAEVAICDVIIRAPRRILDNIHSIYSIEVKQIEKAIRVVSEGDGCHINNIKWVALLQENHFPIEADASRQLSRIDSEHIKRSWEKALERRTSDPDGAITMAKALIETVCKHILDEMGIQYTKKDDLPKLFHLTTENLHLTPQEYDSKDAKTILGSVKSVVNGIAALRNNLGDAHGKGINDYVPQPVLAELAVRVAGAVSVYLIEVWDTNKRYFNKKLI